MTEDKKLPQWAVNYIQFWKEKLHLCEWTIESKMSDRPCEDFEDETKACVRLTPLVLHASIEWSSAMPGTADEDWQKTIVHEMLHIRLARVTEYVSDNVLPEISMQVGLLLQRGYKAEFEPVVELLSETLWSLRHGK